MQRDSMLKQDLPISTGSDKMGWFRRMSKGEGKIAYSSSEMQGIGQISLNFGFWLFEERGRQDGHTDRGQQLSLPAGWKSGKEWRCHHDPADPAFGPLQPGLARTGGV